MSVRSVGNDKGDNEMIPGIIDEGCATSHHIKRSHLPPNDVGRVAQLLAIKVFIVEAFVYSASGSLMTIY